MLDRENYDINSDFSMGLIRTAAILAIDNRLGGTILKQAPFWGVNFSLVRKNMRGSNFMT